MTFGCNFSPCRKHSELLMSGKLGLGRVMQGRGLHKCTQKGLCEHFHSGGGRAQEGHKGGWCSATFTPGMCGSFKNTFSMLFTITANSRLTWCDMLNWCKSRESFSFFYSSIPIYKTWTSVFLQIANKFGFKRFNVHKCCALFFTCY